MALIGIFAFYSANQSAINVRATNGELEAARAEYVAQAGFQHALRQHAQQGCGPYTDLTNQPLGSHSYTTSLTTNLGSTTSYTINVDQDTWIRSDNPTNNNGGDSKLHIRFEGGIIERPMYRYDLSPIAANSSILSATAWFYVSKEHPEGPVDIHLLNADWNDSDATWNSMGDQMDSSVIASIAAQSAPAVWVAVNLTPQVQAWVNGQANYGIAMNSTSEGTHGDYASIEATQKPYLEVIVGTPATTTASLTSVGVLANGLKRTIVRNSLSLYQYPSGLVEMQPDGSEGIDASLSQSNHDYNYGSSDRIWVQDASSADDDHSLLKFSLGRIPKNARIENATLRLYQYYTSTPGGIVGIHRVTQSWTEGDEDGGIGWGATWNSYQPFRNWADPGGDFDGETIATANISGGTAGYYDWDMTHLVQNWVSGTYANDGFILIPETLGTDVGFRSSDHSTVAERPKLTVSYSCRCDISCFAPRGFGRIALIGDDSTPDTDDQVKIDIIESWGYEVDFYEDRWISFINWNNYDLAYVSETVISGDVNTQLADLSMGVVNEEPLLYPDMAQGNGFSDRVDSIIEISDNSHYITAPFALGALPIYSGDMEILSLDTPLPNGTQVLAEHSGDSVLTVLDEGAINNSGNPSAGRRVTLPLGRHYASDFNWTQLNNNGHLLVQRSIAWAMGADKSPGTHQLLMVVVDPNNLRAQEIAKQGLIESWDYEVTLIDESDSQSAFDDAVMASDVVFIGQDVSSGNVNTKLLDAPIGVVNEEGNLADDFGIAGGYAWRAGTELTVENNLHYITQPFELGALTILTGSEELLQLTPGYAPDLQILGSNVSERTLVALETGASLLGGSTAAGRRVMLPWGGSQMDINNLNDDGLTIFRRALDWARGENLAGPIAHWKLDETSGLVAIDSEGGHDGTLTNGPARSQGIYGGAVTFSGETQAIIVPHDDALSITEELTLMAWINLDELKLNRPIVRKGPDNITHNYYLGVNNDSIIFALSPDEGGWNSLTSGATGMQPGRWYHVVATFDNATDTVRFYLDGVLVSTKTTVISPQTNTGTLHIGRNDNNYGFPGVIDDVRIYDRLLNSGEIAELAVRPGPIAHWKLDDGSGNTAVDSAGGHNATITNPVWDPSGQDGGSLRVAALNQAGAAPHDDALNLTRGLTLMAWVNKAQGWGYDAAIDKASSGSDINYFLGTWEDEIVFGFSTTTDNWQGYYTSGVNLTLGSWNHIAASFDNTGDEVRIYRNGSLVQTFPTTLEPVTNSGNLWLGRSALTNELLNGRLDDARIYNRVLDAAEILAIHDATAGGGGGGGGGGEPLSGSCTFRDEFENGSYNNQDGNANWGGEWQRSTTGNDISLVTGGNPDDALKIQDDDRRITRAANLGGHTSGTLSLDYRRVGLENGEYVALIVFSSGEWTELTQFGNPPVSSDGSYQTYSADISDYLTADFQIRLASPDGGMSNIDDVYFDNLQIEVSGGTCP